MIAGLNFEGWKFIYISMIIFCKSASICIKCGIYWGEPESAAPIVCCMADISVVMDVYVCCMFIQ